jgi:cysteine desulfuration protein SufE
MAIRGGAAYLKAGNASRRDIMTIDEINENFALLDEWDDRYRYLIELGRMMPPLPDASRTDVNKVQGCASQVWLTTDIAPGPSGPVLTFVGDSDAHIVRGLFAQAGARHSGDRCARAVRQAGPARAPHAAALERTEIDGWAHPQRRAPRARRRGGAVASFVGNARHRAGSIRSATFRIVR